MQKLNKKSVLNYLLQSVIIISGSFMLALSMYMFTIPAKFAPGGVSGLSSIIEIVFNFSASYSLIIFNIPLLILAFLFLSKPFAIKSTITIILTSGIMQIFKLVHFYQYVDPNNMILSSIAGGLLYGVGIGLLINIGSSSGGTDIISMLIRKKISSISISWIIFLLNVVIVLFGGLMYLTVLKMNPTTVLALILYSILENFVCSKCMELVMKGASSSVKFEVITSMPEELSQAISQQTKRGVTIVDSHGGYSNEKNYLVICIVYKTETQLLRKIVKEIDPKSFAYVMDTREVWGNGFQ